MNEPPVYRATSPSAAYDGLDRLPVAVWLDNVRSLYNVGSFFRTSDAVRADRIFLAGITADPGDRRIAKTALGAEQTMPWTRVERTVDELNRLRESGWQIAAIETTVTAVDLFDWVPAFPVCTIFGHEVDGVASAILDCCDVHVRIPTLGSKQSLNVATAGGVVLYELLRKYREMSRRAGC
jgi:23S rRNA (guanosine2251-2'-O)-methyltransferase